ncbi:MAG: pitrilysin family protein [Fulvivirga sp.]|uniref:M16 family metallopeptidase n=1 Tax=Fulvivirga sp. TaxID=1931237 RepID=UPI0032ED6C36
MLNRKIAPVLFKPAQLVFPEPESIQLSTGLKVHLFQNRNVDAIKVEFIFRNASSYREPLNGINLLTSKLLMSGTSSKSSKEISDGFARLGSFIEVNPSFDYTTVDIHCVKKTLFPTLTLFSEILRDSNFPDDEIGLQKSILINNYKIQQQKNNIVASRLFRKSLFPEHPYGQSVIPQDLEKIDLKNIIEFYKNNWSSFEIIISGNISIDELKSFEKDFTYEPHFANYLETFTYSKKVLNNHRPNSVQTSLKIGLPTINKSHTDYTSLLFTNYVLGGYFGSRLMKNIREEKGLTYGIYSSIVNLQHASYFTITSEVSSKKKELAIDEIVNEIKMLSSSQILDEELITAKNHWIGSFQNDLSSPYSLIEKFKSYYLYNLEPNYILDFYNSINKIKPHDIIDASKNYLNTNQMSLISVGG